MPAHATPEMTAKIQAAIGKLATGFSSSKPVNGQPQKKLYGKFYPEDEVVSVEEAIRRAKA
jgi:hypothetical protein